MSTIAASVNQIRSLELMASGDSVLHRVSAQGKLLFTFVFILFVISVPAYDLFLVLPFLIYPAFACAAARIPFGLFAKRVAVALPFLCFAGVANLIFDRTSVHFGSLTLPGGVVSFAVLILKMILTVGSVLILAATTPLNRIAGALRSFHVPCVIILQLLLTWRYLIVIFEEAGKMIAAYQLRAPGRRGIPVRDWHKLAGSLLLRSISRAGRIYGAMQCRLFDARVPLVKTERMRACELLFLLPSFALCAVLRFLPLILERGA